MTCPSTHAMFMVGGKTNKTGTETYTTELALFIPEKDLYCELSIEFPVSYTKDQATHGFTVCGGSGGRDRCRTLNVTTGMWIDPSWNLCPSFRNPQIWGSKDGLVLVEATQTGLLQPKKDWESNSIFGGGRYFRDNP